jgi:hypothetical protein
VSRRCRFYFEDSYRHGAKKECRLIQLNPGSEDWHEGICRTCRVPEILHRNPCANLALEAEVSSRLRVFSTVKVFAVCTVKMEKVADPATCNQRCDEYRSLA